MGRCGCGADDPMQPRNDWSGGATPNAVKTQIWIAVLAYALVHLLKHRHGFSQTPNEIVQILSVMILEKAPINQPFSEIQMENPDRQNCN